MCKADCVVSKYEIRATDTSFANLAANPPQLEAICDRLLTAWKLFNKVVDTSIVHPQNPPWWLREAASSSCAYAELLNPSAASVIQESHDELTQLVVAGLNSQSEQEDAMQLVAVITNAADSQQWVLGWEYGTRIRAKIWVTWRSHVTQILAFYFLRVPCRCGI
jgi:hypothetical protein